MFKLTSKTTALITVFVLPAFIPSQRSIWNSSIPLLPITASEQHRIGSFSPQKLALLIGINDYRRTGYPSLFGCHNDAGIMKQLLIGKYDFEPENIRTLLDSQATRATIIQVFQDHLIGKANRNDIIVFYYSGHGSQIKDDSGDERLDGKDETIVPYDSRQGEVFDITDDEINDLLKQLGQKNCRVTFIFDSCNSGTLSRGAGKVRWIPEDHRPRPNLPASFSSTRSAREGESDWRPENLDYVLIAGSRAHEDTREYYVEGKAYGALTYFLAKELAQAGPGATYRDVMDNVIGQVSSVYPFQHPQLEGTAGDRYVFSDSSSLMQPYVLASPLAGDKVALQAGTIHGLTTGSVFEIYLPRTKNFSQSVKSIAKVELTEVLPLTATAKIVAGNLSENASRAVERRHNYADLRLLVYLAEPAKSPTLRKILTELEKYDYIKIIGEARGYHLLLRQEGDELLIEGGDTTEVSPRVSASNSDAIEGVVASVLQWAKWFNILSIANATPAFEIGFTLQAMRAGTRGQPFQHIEQVVATLQENDQFECVITNPTHTGLYISILDLSTDGMISVIFPQEGRVELLPGGKTKAVAFEAYVPDGHESVKDVLKVFATTTPVNFHNLIQPAILRRGEKREVPDDSNDPLSQLLRHAALGTTRSDRSVDTNLWATVQRVLEVRRKEP